MEAEADMVPKDSGFNQSEADSGMCARLPWQEMVKLSKGCIFIITET